MQPRLGKILDPILRDLTNTCPVMLEIGEGRLVVGPIAQLVFVVRDFSGSESRVSIPLGQHLVQDIADTAARMQEIASEALWFESKPVAWPQCPQHPGTHPLEAVVSSTAVWRCPLTREVVAEIGTLSVSP